MKIIFKINRTWRMNLVVIDGPVDAVVDDVGVVVEAKVMQHLDGSRQRCDRVCLLRAHE